MENFTRAAAGGAIGAFLGGSSATGRVIGAALGAGLATTIVGEYAARGASRVGSKFAEKVQLSGWQRGSRKKACLRSRRMKECLADDFSMAACRRKVCR